MYLWIVITGGVFSFFAAMGIGANDAANAFATSVGSKALTIKQAVLLSCIFETGGAILMGSHVSETIRNGIADYECFVDQPELLMYGCMWVAFSVGAWLFLASYWEMPVSTTHSCVGGMIGMTWSLKGYQCVKWYVPTDNFPWIGGVSGIVISWFISPIFSALIAMVAYGTIRQFVLRKPFNSKRIYYLYPLLIGSTITLNTFFIIYKGAKGLGLDKIPTYISIPVSIGSGIVTGCLVIPILPCLRKYINKKYSTSSTINHTDIELTNPSINNIKNINERNKIIVLHQSAEKFDIRTEELFKYLQIFTAACDAFSHGANDVANAIGPFVAIYTIYQVNDITQNSVMNENAYWILGTGGAGISLGLLVYGYKIINAIGTKLCKITPSRGAIIELSSAIIIIIGSRLKIPLSTTHCQIGATIGVGLLENIRTMSGINGKLLLKMAFGWLITCIVVGGSTGLLVAQGVYGPTIESSHNLTNLTNCSN
jgi:solute carrier family 20 (sodium-dependent phosphate transporter)